MTTNKSNNHKNVNAVPQKKTARNSHKIIYKPVGSAGEYSPWAANLYVGCSNGCSYCFCKHGVLKHALGGDTAVLKKSLGTEENAYHIFCDELAASKEEIIKDGSLFFTFTSDPCLHDTIDLNFKCIAHTIGQDVPCTILTKRADWLDSAAWQKLKEVIADQKKLLRVGFTLTGLDNLEPGASTNQDRIEAMKALHSDGFPTWASVEPVVHLDASLSMIEQCAPFCDHMKIGLVTGQKRNYGREDVLEFMSKVRAIVPEAKVYWKHSVLKVINKA